MSEEKAYAIGELAQTAAVTTRTIRYYVAEELLPPPEGSGRAATYSGEHLARLELIKILKDEYLPLQEIRTLLRGLDYRAVQELLAQKQRSDASPLPAQNSAKEYLQRLLAPSSSDTSGFMRHQLERRQEHAPPHRSMMAQLEGDHKGDDQAGSVAPPSPAATARRTAASESVQPQAASPSSYPGNSAVSPANRTLDRLKEIAEEAGRIPGQVEAATRLTRWQRLEITPGIELHIQEGLEHSHIWQKIEQLIKVARQILK
jgi:DNA-binding transcriptional MerR regulator